jgi:hypothetical protein
MTHSTDVFQPECERLAIPAQNVTVLVDGLPCPELEVIEITRSGWPLFDRARLALDFSDSVPDRFTPGVSIRILQLTTADPPQHVLRGLPLFAGHVDSVETTINEDTAAVEIVARDFSATLERITVHGQHIAQDDGATILLAGLQTVFNPGCQGNATAPEGGTRTLFSSRPSQDRLWTCAEAIDYLLAEYLPAGSLHWPDLMQLEAMADASKPRDLDVTGLTLLEALHRCAQAAGLSFRFMPRLTETGPGHWLAFHRNDAARRIELNLQPAVQRLSASRTDVAGFRSTRHFHPVTHRIVGQGDFKVYEATFELVKAWDPTLESTDYATFSASTNPDFARVKNVYRKWCLNEAGDYATPPFDFSSIFEPGCFAHRRRRFWPALSRDGSGRSAGYFLEVSFEDGANWRQYPYPFNNQLDECGVWLSSDRLDIDTWVAALKGTLRFRVTASVVSDERLTCIAADGPVGSTIPVIDHLVTLPRRFQYRKVSPVSIFPPTGDSDQIDDAAALWEFVRRKAANAPTAVQTFQVQTTTLALHLHPGDHVTAGPDSRDWLGCRRDGRSIARIENVRMDFRNQTTELSIVRQRR